MGQPIFAMKKIIPFFLTLALLALASFTGCKKNETPAGDAQKTADVPAPSSGATSAPVSKAAPVSAEKTSFQEVTSQLDPGGNLYLYLSTEQLLENVSGKVSGLRQLFGAIPQMQSDDQEKLGKGLDIVTNLLKNSGIEEVSGFGLSSIAREPGLYHSKALLHHFKGKGSGFLWTMFGQKPHALDGLSLLTTNTALAMFSDFDVPLLWSVLQKQVSQSGFPQAEELLNKLPESFEKATGLKWEQVLGSLGGEFGFALTLDDSKKVSIPLPGSEPLEIPAPALMLVAKVKDDTIFNRIDKALKSTGQQVFSVDKPDLKLRTMPLPIPLPIQLGPTVATSDGYLFIATTEVIVQEALAVKSGKTPGLKSTEEFQHLAKDVPTQGNHFSFLSQRFGETMKQIQRQALSMTTAAPGASKQWLQTFLSSGPAAVSYGVGANTEEGWLTVANGNQHPAKMLLVAAAVPAGMLSAIAIPNFVKARQTAQRTACANNLRQIEVAKKQWAVENNKAATDTPSQEELLPFLGNRMFPACPGGGSYTINAVSTRAECSLPAHSAGDQ
jgi:hypothetical protein